MRALVAGLMIGLVAVTALVTAPSAHALSCAVPVPARMVAGADAAFVGRLVDATPDRWIFAVDESVKGGLGAQVELRRSGPADVSGWFRPQAGVQIGLVAYRGEDGVLATNDCGRLTPAQLRAAAQAPDVSCLRPRVRSVRFRQPGRVDVALGGLDDPSTSVTVGWGDGTTSTRTLGRGDVRRIVTVRHRYGGAGRRKITVAVAGHPVAACGEMLERATATPLVVQTPRT